MQRSWALVRQYKSQGTLCHKIYPIGVISSVSEICLGGGVSLLVSILLVTLLHRFPMPLVRSWLVERENVIRVFFREYLSLRF